MPQSAFDWLPQMGAQRPLLAGLACILAVAAAGIAWRARSRLGSLRNEHRNMAELVDNLDEGIYRSSLDGRQLSANKALVRLNGYDSEAEMLAGVGDIATEWYVDPHRRAEFSAILHRDGVVRDFVSEIYRHKTRERIWITESARIVRHRRSGKALYYEGSVRDITETVRRLEVERQFQKLTSTVPGVLFQWRVVSEDQHRMLFLSPGFEAMTGLSRDIFEGDAHEFLEHVVEADRPAYLRSLRRTVLDHHPLDHEFRFHGPNGAERWFRVSATPERTPEGTLLHGYLNDISLRKRQAVEIEKLAFYDALTGLPNRRLLRDRVTQVIAECKRERRFGALLFIDLDNFKPLNDTQGHDIGDEYLTQVADRLSAAVGPRDTVARIGGDEFVVLLADLGLDLANGSCTATSIAQSILRQLADNFQLGIVQHQSSASIGMVAFDGAPVRVEDLLKRADIAMYEAKSSGRNQIAVFDPAILARETERYELVKDLRFAISEHRFELRFQPRVTRDGRICGAQADVAWRHPERGALGPEVFVPLAAQIGLEDDLGMAIVTLGLGVLRRWQARPETRSLQLAINIGVTPIARSDFAPSLERMVARTGVDASCMTLEISEAVPAGHEPCLAAGMMRLKRLGLRFSLDRFGSGKPPLESLKVLPFDEVRVVGRFVADITGAGFDRVMAQSLFGIADQLGLSSVAGDVATPAQEALLFEAGCAILEGPNYGPALPEPLFIDLVAAHHARQPSTPPFLAETG